MEMHWKEKKEFFEWQESNMTNICEKKDGIMESTTYRKLVTKSELHNILEQLFGFMPEKEE